MFGFGLSLLGLKFDDEVSNVLQGVDAAVNTIALSGAASWFLLNLESRWRRRAVLSDLHELRSIAHVVDMRELNGVNVHEAGDESLSAPEMQLHGHVH